MSDDLKIQEEELKKELAKLEQELHMKTVRKLSRKQSFSAKLAVQRKQMQQLEKQIGDLEPTVSACYSLPNHVKDNQMKGFFIYLLTMKEHFAKEVRTKRDVLHQKEEEIKNMKKELCVQHREYAKKLKAEPHRAREFVQLENMSNKINQMEKNICSVKHENKETLESIKDLQISLKQYKKLQNEFREKIGRMQAQAQVHLKNAVSSYEEREEFIYKRNMYQSVCALDMRKADINENALNRTLEKTETFEKFGAVQKKERSDSRIATTGELIEQGVTGLEPELNRAKDLHSAIVESSGRAVPSEMDDQFKLTDDQANSQFSYLEQHLELIHRTQNEIKEMKEKNKKLLKGMSEQKRRMIWEISENKEKASKSKSEADAAVESVNRERVELDKIMEKVRSFYLKCGSDEKKIASLEEEEKAGQVEIPQEEREENEEIDDSNALQFTEKIEKRILEVITLIEYDRMKKYVKEEAPQLLVGNDEDGPIIEEDPKVEFLDTIRPRKLRSKVDLQCTLDMHNGHDILSLDQLKSKAVAAVAEIESGKSSEDDDSTASRKSTKKD